MASDHPSSQESESDGWRRNIVSNLGHTSLTEVDREENEVPDQDIDEEMASLEDNGSEEDLEDIAAAQGADSVTRDIDDLCNIADSADVTDANPFGPDDIAVRTFIER